MSWSVIRPPRNLLLEVTYDDMVNVFLLSDWNAMFGPTKQDWKYTLRIGPVLSFIAAVTIVAFRLVGTVGGDAMTLAFTIIPTAAMIFMGGLMIFGRFRAGALGLAIICFLMVGALVGQLIADMLA